MLFCLQGAVELLSVAYEAPGWDLTESYALCLALCEQALENVI